MKDKTVIKRVKELANSLKESKAFDLFGGYNVRCETDVKTGLIKYTVTCSDCGTCLLQGISRGNEEIFFDAYVSCCGRLRFKGLRF